MQQFEIDGPTAERTTVRFKNWDAPGLLIHGRKLQEDIANYRQVAAFLSSHGTEGARLALMMESRASQYETAQSGEEPKAS